MKTLLYTIALIFSCMISQAQTTVYLIPGQGGDERLFNNLQLDDVYQIKHIDYELPDEGSSMKDYAEQLSKQIDTSEPFIVIGVSLGGMLASEIHDIVHPEKTIIISSAQSSLDLPKRYKLQQKVPLYKLVSGKVARWSAFVLQPIVEYDRNKEKETFKAMLTDKDPEFLARTIPMIMEWDKTTRSEGLIQIHGSRDSTIPVKNVNCDYLVEDGSHMMVLTEGEKISDLVKEILLKQ